MAEIGVAFFSEYCEKCKIALDLPAHVSRCYLCGNKPVFRWVIYRPERHGIDLCTPEEINEVHEARR